MLSETQVFFKEHYTQFRRVKRFSYWNLTFRFQHLSHQGLECLQEALQNLVSLQKFSLDLTSCQNIHEIGMSHLAKGLQGLTSLQDLTLIFSKQVSNRYFRLNLRCDIVNDEAFLSLAQLVKKLKNSSLKKVHFDFSTK